MMTEPVAATISVAEAAALLGMSRATLYRAIDRGDIVAIRYGRAVQIPRHVVDDLLANGNNQAATA
jgi:excisionase family DNA binding protein